METVKKVSQSPEWVDSFVTAFSSHYQQEIEHEAEVNVRTLPKVVWNDNTFYVSLDKEESCADIFNEYGNVVTALKNVASIEDVEHSLNKKIIADISTPAMKKTDQKVHTSLDEMLPKMATQLGLQADATLQDVTKVAEQQIQEDKQSNGISSNNDTSDNQELLSKINTLTKQNRKVQSELNSYKKKFTKLASSLEQLSGLVDQLYARMNPDNVYDIDAQKAEVEHFNNTAANSAKMIDIEHHVDLTTPNGRTSLKDVLLQDLDTIDITPVKEEIQPVEVNINIHNEAPVEIIDKSEVNSDKEDVKLLDSPSEPEKISPKEAALFKQQICPECHTKALRLQTKTASVQNVICKHCNQLYGVNLDNEEIFKQ